MKKKENIIFCDEFSLKFMIPLGIAAVFERVYL